MKCLVVSYGIKEYDGRLRELYNMMKNVGETDLICCSIYDNTDTFTVNTKQYISFKTITKYYINFLKKIFMLRKYDIILFDNYFVAPLGLIFKFCYPNKYLIQDVRELYLYKDMKSFKSKFFIKLESTLVKRANLVLVANNDRSIIMTNYLHLKKRPLIYENIRFLNEFISQRDKVNFDNKYNNLYKDKFVIISTGGLSVKRGILRILKAFKELGQDYHLVCVGGGSPEDIREVKKFIQNNQIENVTIMDKVEAKELKYLVSKSKIGLVNYHKEDLNNKYCSSGKIYEYLNEGLPLVTTENPPLKEFIDIYKVGEYDDLFIEGIKKVRGNYDFYSTKVKEAMVNISPEKYNQKIASQIIGLYKAYKGKING